jgi:D-serine deaminase-like pyridoxal phosphate-dependent protein
MLNIIKPTLLLNRNICMANIHAMAVKAHEQNVIFRPHFKTHQSATIGEWFRNEGVTAITVSSVSMAQYFANHGWKDITIAFPVNLLEINEINQLASEITLNLLIEAEEVAAFLTRNLKSASCFFIKIDTGYHRTGIDPSNIPLIDRILKGVKASKLSFKGFLTHSGQAYHAHDRPEFIHIQQTAADHLKRLKSFYQHQFPELILSVGDTPTCSQLPAAEGIDEIRPGNFVFFDVMQFALGSCRLEEIAVALICPVVAVHLNRMEAVIYGGAVHLSKEQTLLPPDLTPVYGLAFKWNGKNLDLDNVLGRVSSLSQEHGIISLNQAGCNLKPGNLVAILPVHSCLTAQLMRKYYDLNGEEIETINS